MPRLPALLAPFLLGLLSACQDHKTYKQLGQSMEPTILAGENVFIDESAYLIASPRRGDIVTFRPPEKVSPGHDLSKTLFVFRIIAIPGDTIAIKDHALFVNGTRAAYQYGDATGFYADVQADRSHAPVYPLTVQADHYFVCGDGRETNDSRRWGLLPAARIIGKVIGK